MAIVSENYLSLFFFFVPKQQQVNALKFSGQSEAFVCFDFFLLEWIFLYTVKYAYFFFNAKQTDKTEEQVSTSYNIFLRQQYNDLQYSKLVNKNLVTEYHLQQRFPEFCMMIPLVTLILSLRTTCTFITNTVIASTAEIVDCMVTSWITMANHRQCEANSSRNREQNVTYFLWIFSCQEHNTNTNISRMTTSITASCTELKYDLSTTTPQSETKQNLHTLGCILDKFILNFMSNPEFCKCKVP